MQNSIKLGEEIKRVRSKLKYEQKEFAKILGISNVYLSNIEKGKKIPSSDLLEKIYKEVGTEIPEDIFEVVKKSRLENKKNSNISSSSILYELQENNIYNVSKLKELLKTDPQNIKYIYGLLSLFKEDGKNIEARNLLLNSLVNIKKQEHKRWIEACYFLIEGNYKTAIDLMKKAIVEFEKNKHLEDNYIVRKAGLIFELAVMYYEYGYYSYNVLFDKKLALENFYTALDFFEEQRKLATEASYEMYYVSVFWWLAYLGEKAEKNWSLYIETAENVLILNHEYIMKKSSVGKISGSLYSTPYIIQLIGGMAESYAQLALLEKKKKEKLALLKKGELLFVQNIPINILPDRREYYNFYFSYACFFSIKAEIYESLSMNYETILDLCGKGISEIVFSDKRNKVKMFSRDILEAEKKELMFYSQKRADDFFKIKERANENE